MERNKRVLLFLSLFLWTALLFILALQPKALVFLLLKKAAAFKTAHLAAYAVLAYLACYWIHTLWPSWKRSTFFSLGVSLFGGFALAFLCGAATEFVQIFSADRIPDIKDLKLDLLGASYGLGFFFLSRLGHLFPWIFRKPARAHQLDLFLES